MCKSVQIIKNYDQMKILITVESRFVYFVQVKTVDWKVRIVSKEGEDISICRQGYGHVNELYLYSSYYKQGITAIEKWENCIELK